MLRSAGIRSKILAVLVVPLVLLGITTGLLATQQVGDARQAYEVEKIAAIGGSFGELVRLIAAERAVTAATLQGDPAAVEALPGLRAQVDAGLAQSRAEVAMIDSSRLSPQAGQALGRVAAAHDDLGRVRTSVDRRTNSLDSFMEDYDDILREDLAMPGRVAVGVDDRRTADLLVGFGHLLAARDLALREKEVGLRILSNTDTAGDGASFAGFGPALDDEISEWQFTVGSTDADEMAVPLDNRTGIVWSIGSARLALASPGTVGRSGLTPEIWSGLTDARLTGLESALAGVAAEVNDSAAAASQRATIAAAAAGVTAVLGVGITLLLSLVLARRIARPLRELTAAATSVREQLPVMVEQMRSPGQLPDVQLPRIDVQGDDEVGRLAAAFNAVNDTVVEVAAEQAALRGSIAETFVNVARRNQVLLSRQLSFIDHLEQREENPDTLENLFRLDHLATRMRRNAESLLVLANIDAGRRLRQPLALSDVIRTAASEIEQYERVNLALQVDPPTIGHLSLQLAHLLAELLENGTNFSEPHTPVLVATSRTGTGIRITVTDEGLGLTDDEIELARTKISHFAADDVVTSQRLGFFVVGRLARRLGVTVSVRRGPAKGLVVTVDLPPSLFVPGTVKVADPEPGAAVEAAPGRPASASPAPAPIVTAAPGAPAPGAPSARPQVPAARPGRAPARPGAPAPTAAPVPVRSAAPAAPTPVAPVAPVVSAPVAMPRPAVVPARPTGVPIPMPGQAPDVNGLQAVTVAPGGAVLPRRSHAAPAEAPATEAPATEAPATEAPATEAPATEAPVPSVVPAVAAAAPAVAEADTSVAGSMSSLVEAPLAPWSSLSVPAAATAPAEPSDDVTGINPVIAAGSASLPTRSRRDSTAAPAPAPAPTRHPAQTTGPATPSTSASTATASTPPTSLPGDTGGVTPPRRAGLFGAFRARREDPELPVATGVVPASTAPHPVPAARVPSHAQAPAPVPTAPSPAPAVVTAAAPVAPAPVAPAPVAAAPVAPAPVQARVGGPFVAQVAAPTPAPAPVPAPEPAPLLASPTSILPGGGPRRRGRRSMFGGGRPSTVPAPAPTPAPTSALPTRPTLPTLPTLPAVPFPAPVHRPTPRPASPSVPAQGTGPARSTTAAAGPLLGTAARPAGPTDTAPGGPVRQSRPAGPGFPAANGTAMVGDVPVVPALADGEALRQRSMLASEALSELSRLSSYSPSAVQGSAGGPAPLVRRQPAATEAARLPEPPTGPAPERRHRSAADVRSMLSGFQSGVTRGRAGSDGGPDADSHGPREPVPTETARSHPTTTRSTTDTRTTD